MSTALEILIQEFPELSQDVVERALNDHDNDYRAAKTALLLLTSPQGSRARLMAEEPAEDDEAGGSDGWLSWLGLTSGHSPRASSKGWNLGLDEVQAGLSKVGAHVALGLRQAAHTIGHYIPDDLNPFADEDEYLYIDDEEEKERRRKDKESTVVVSPNLTKRGQIATGSSIGSPRGGNVSDEDLSPTAAKKWE